MSDICLISEGGFPFQKGDVADWTEQLILKQNYTFSLLCLTYTSQPLKYVYPIPENVLEIKTFSLEHLPNRVGFLQKKGPLLSDLKNPLKNFFSEQYLEGFHEIALYFAKYRNKLGRKFLLESKEAWDLLIELYNAWDVKGSFVDFFWSFIVLCRSFYAIFFASFPKSKLYHALGAGYSGLMLARIKQEMNVPTLLTDHDLYGSNRKIEHEIANWFGYPDYFHTPIQKETKTLKDLWMHYFSNATKTAAHWADAIITMHKEKQNSPLFSHADRHKIHLISRGIDVKKFTGVVKDEKGAPTVAFVGVIQPIHDLKTFIRSISILKKQIPYLRGLIIGSLQEYPDYVEECKELVASLKLQDICIFLGDVPTDLFLSKIDLKIHTALREVPELEILRAGAAGIPIIATQTGAFREIICGHTGENPKLGEGGAIVPLSDPVSIADAASRLLTDPNLYTACSYAIKKRIETYYQIQRVEAAYHQLYETYLRNP